MINFGEYELQKLYIAYFGRPGDPLGLKYWLSPSNELLTLREISNQLSMQDEYVTVSYTHLTLPTKRIV